jgi:photosystem II stability/assembly factor-like uncharacterized protein
MLRSLCLFANNNDRDGAVETGRVPHKGRPFNTPVLFCIFASLLLGMITSTGVCKSPVTAKARLPHDLLSVSFPTEREGWACGRWGTILHSSDGGQNWTAQISGTDYTLSSITFTDPQHGWAVGDGGTIVSTEDGGRTWEKQKSPTTLFLMGVHFTDTKKGWAVGEKTHILHTADGGRTWSVQFKDQDYILKCISFCDERNGWAVGEYGLIYHTQDGGRSWNIQAGGMRLSEETGEIEAGNILFAVLALDTKTVVAAGIDGSILKTTDGGTSWKGVGKNVPKVHLFGLAQGGGKVIIVGNGFMAVSLDGGITFKEPQVEPKISYGWLYGVRPRGKEGFVAVGKDGCIYLTDGKAQTWRSVEKKIQAKSNYGG